MKINGILRIDLLVGDDGDYAERADEGRLSIANHHSHGRQIILLH